MKKKYFFNIKGWKYRSKGLLLIYYNYLLFILGNFYLIFD